MKIENNNVLHDSDDLHLALLCETNSLLLTMCGSNYVLLTLCDGNNLLLTLHDVTTCYLRV